jgi:hypothetical protein
MEGSRFGSHPKDLALFLSARVWPRIFLTGGSRERLNASFVSWYVN